MSKNKELYIGQIDSSLTNKQIQISHSEKYYTTKINIRIKCIDQQHNYSNLNLLIEITPKKTQTNFNVKEKFDICKITKLN